MRDLIVRLTTSDGGAADALRVIAHFDTLVDHRASALAILRAAAALAECPVGFDDPDRAMRVAVDADGKLVPDVSGPTAAALVDEFAGVTVWLDRGSDDWPLDRLVLERFARSLHAVKRGRDVSPVVAAIRTACDADVQPVEREEALRYLGIGATVAVVVTRLDDAPAMVRGLDVDGGFQLHLFDPDRAPGEVPPDVAAGVHVCPAADVHREWARAVTARRIAVDTTGRPIHVRYSDLGSIAAVVETVDADTARANPDVRCLVELQGERPWVVPTLDLMLSGASIREAARSQNLHHSTMRQRLDWLERRLGYTSAGMGHARASLAVTLWRIAVAADHSQTTDNRR
ncbi:hypothetical protein [Tsukamurella hominis]|uniref:hypothetical protein n=1 Tax=Tsukamurella hominis TaxID=1970232 RepID=UPI0039E9BB5E